MDTLDNKIITSSKRGTYNGRYSFKTTTIENGKPRVER